MHNDSAAEERQMILDAQKGSVDALAQLIERHEPLIYLLSNRVRCVYIEKEELVQAGILGFIQAVKKYRMEYETKISTYAVPWILGEMKSVLRKQVPKVRHLSLDADSQEEGCSLQNVIPGSLDIDVNGIDLRMAFEKLNSDEQLLICLRYFRGKTQKETAQLLGKSQAQISRQERTALDKLRVYLS